MEIPDYLIIFQVKRITNLQCIRTGPYGFPGTRVDVIPAGAKCPPLDASINCWDSTQEYDCHPLTGEGAGMTPFTGVQPLSI